MADIFASLDDKKIADRLKDGAIGVIPTDTVYGLVCRAADEAAVRRLYAIKKRHNKPGTIIAADIDQLVELGFKRRYLTAVEQFWPAAISVETPFSDPTKAYLTQNQPTIAVRIPADKKLHNLLVKTGALQTTSANPTGQDNAHTIQQARAYFHDEVDFYVDGGDRTDQAPSTIIRVVDDAVEVFREGAVTIKNNGVST